MLLSMSRKERDRLKVIDQLERGKLKQVEAGRIMRVSARQVRRLLKKYREKGDAGIVHGLRGKPSNNRISDELQNKAVKLVRKRYWDFGPTLAGEYLGSDHKIIVSRETLRKWMIKEEIWKPRRHRAKHRQWRERKALWGEMVQMDTSIHDWFEGRGEESVLIAMIDDATSKLYARFYNNDSTGSNMSLIRSYIKRYGRPVCIYVDNASHFKTTRETTIEEDLRRLNAETQIERALRELNIGHISAHSPQAKGRVERLFGTLQDRLIKGMRLEGISTIEKANEYLYRKFVPVWNRRFTVKPAKDTDAHRSNNEYNLDAIFSIQEKRVVANDYTIRYRNKLYQIEKSGIQCGLRGSKILVENRLDGSLRLCFRGKYLKFHEITHLREKNEQIPFPNMDSRLQSYLDEDNQIINFPAS